MHSRSLNSAMAFVMEDLVANTDILQVVFEGLVIAEQNSSADPCLFKYVILPLLTGLRCLDTEYSKISFPHKTYHPRLRSLGYFSSTATCKLNVSISLGSVGLSESLLLTKWTCQMSPRTSMHQSSREEEKREPVECAQRRFGDWMWRKSQFEHIHGTT
jgi:hypothetical protein